jgi:hypothetical protein
MGVIALLALLMLMHNARRDGTLPRLDTPPDGAQHPVAAAHRHARKARQKAAETGKPADHAAAEKAADTAIKTQQAYKTATASPVPSGLPAFPAGWTPDQPPPPAVVSRAFALLPALWAKGAGATKTEQTAGRWITYQAQAMAGGKKGVVAFKVKPGLTPTTPSRQSTANV